MLIDEGLLCAQLLARDLRTRLEHRAKLVARVDALRSIRDTQLRGHRFLLLPAARLAAAVCLDRLPAGGESRPRSSVPVALVLRSSDSSATTHSRFLSPESTSARSATCAAEAGVVAVSPLRVAGCA